MPGSTQKCSSQHASVDIAITKHSPPCDVIASHNGFRVPTGVPHREIELQKEIKSLQQLIWNQTQTNTRIEHLEAHASHPTGQLMPLI